jgi:restriction endonuclease S subunit
MKFYKEAEFQETLIGKIPKEWSFAKLEEIAKVTTGGNAPQGEEYFRDGKCPFIRVQHFDGNRLYVDKWDLINERAVKEYGLKLLPKDSTIFPKSGASINLEKRALLPLDAFVVNHLCVLIPKRKTVDSRFLFYLMKRINLSRTSAGTTLPYLNLETISKVIAKTERLKKGLMQHLLTRGIEHTEYKDTPIGKMPESWQVADFNTICQNIIGGVAIETKDFTDSGFPVVSKGDIKEFGQLLLDKKEKKYVSEEFAEMHLNQIVHQGELVLAMRDLSTEMNFLGLAARVVDNHDYLAAQGVGILRISRGIVEPDFVTNLTNSKRYREFIKRKGVGSTQVHLRTNELLSFKFGLPALTEQQQIVTILSIADQKFRLEKQEKAKLERLKAGLMNLLLTGKVRIRVD